MEYICKQNARDNRRTLKTKHFHIKTSFNNFTRPICIFAMKPNIASLTKIGENLWGPTCWFPSGIPSPHYERVQGPKHSPFLTLHANPNASTLSRTALQNRTARKLLQQTKVRLLQEEDKKLEKRRGLGTQHQSTRAVKFVASQKG